MHLQVSHRLMPYYSPCASSVPQSFKNDLAQKNMDLETVNQLGNRLLAKCTPENQELVQGPMSDMNRRWKNLQDKTFDRQVMNICYRTGMHLKTCGFVGSFC